MTPRWARIPQPEPEPARTRHYDIVKEFAIAMVVVLVVTFALAAVFGAPDDKPVTLQSWAKADPNDFTATALSELDGSSSSAGYGPPYNSTPGAGQKIGPLSLQRAAGVRHPVDSAQDFVLTPLTDAPRTADVTAALKQYQSASTDQQNTWTSAYSDALAKAGGDPAQVPAGVGGPVPTILRALLVQAQSGALDGQLLTQGGTFYNNDYTKPLLFLSDGSYLAGLADAKHLSGDQWGMMNETGNFPGQAWLWLYTFWYQISPFDHSGNADALVWGLMAVLTLAFVLVPFIPGVRSIPKYIPIYRLIWRDHYAREREKGS